MTSMPSLGNVISITAFGQRIIILNSLKAAIDLLDKKGAIYSDRPVLPMAGKLLGYDQTLILAPYGHSFRNQRRFLHKYLGSRNNFAKIKPFHDLIESEIRVFLQRMIQTPANADEHAHKYVL